MVQKLYRHGFWAQCGRGFERDFQNLRIIRFADILRPYNVVVFREVAWFDCRSPLLAMTHVI